MDEKEKLYKTIFEQLPIGVFFGKSGEAEFEVNPMFEKIVGRTKKELATLCWEEITHPDDIAEDARNYSMFKSGEIERYTMAKRYVRPDGSIVWANMTIAPLNVGEEIEKSHFCLIEDISEQVKMEKELKESERSHEMLLSNLPGMAYRCDFDRDWTMQFVSDGCYELTGYKPESFVQNRQLSFNNIIDPKVREFLWQKWTRILEQRGVFKEEYYIHTASGERKWVLEQGRGVYGDQGEVLAIEGMIIDISIQKEREDQVRYLNYHDVLTGLFNRSYFEEEKKRLNRDSKFPLSVIMGDINGLKIINDTLGHREGDKLVVTMAKILKECSRKKDVLCRTGGDEFCLMLPKTTHEEALKITKQIIRMCESYQKVEDQAYHISISLGCATKENLSDSLTKVFKEAEDNMYRHKLLQSKSLHSAIISSMKTTLYEKSQETEEHAHRLISLSKAIGQKMGLSDEALNDLELFSTLHDIGKIGISDGILNKPGRLNDEEWREMRKHPEVGYRIAISSQELAHVAEYILSHHEYWNGSGYPQGLKGEEIPLLSRILAVTDAYDAMTQNRAYRKAMSKEAAIEEIVLNSGTQFDPEVARIFIEEVLGDGNRDGEEAI